MTARPFYRDLHPPGRDLDDLDAERLRRKVCIEQARNRGARALRRVVRCRSRVRHAQRPMKRGARFSMKAATPSA